MPRPIRAYIDPAAMEHNLRVVRRYTDARVMAVVKANAYGHGLLTAAEALAGAEGLAVLDPQDAVRLREVGSRQRLLLLEGCFAAEDMRCCAAYQLDSVIHNAVQLDMLDAYPRQRGLDVWLKVNSGMNRLGFPPGDVASVMARLRTHPAVREITLMTHFAQADEPAGVADQLECFNELAYPYRVPRSLANSAALLRERAAHGDWVRPGIMLYGVSPFGCGSPVGSDAAALGLRPAMSLCSEVIAVQTLRAGERIGYAGLFTAPGEMRVGIVACGYADGYPRHAPTGTPVLVEGQRSRTLGRVSMDMLCVDLSSLPEAGIGSEVTLWGAGLPVEEVAQAAGTISYELLCALAPRVPLHSA